MVIVPPAAYNPPPWASPPIAPLPPGPPIAWLATIVELLMVIVPPAAYNPPPWPPPPLMTNPPKSGRRRNSLDRAICDAGRAASDVDRPSLPSAFARAGGEIVAHDQVAKL